MSMEATMGDTAAAACYDCGQPSDDDVCSVCLSLCDDIERLAKHCRSEHGGGAYCACVDNSEAVKAYQARVHSNPARAA